MSVENITSLIPTNQNVYKKVSAHTNWIKKETKGWQVGFVKKKPRNRMKRKPIVAKKTIVVERPIVVEKPIVVDLDTAFLPKELL